MNHIIEWQRRHGVTDWALADLMDTLARGAYGPTIEPPSNVRSEAGVTSLVRLEASRKNVILFRNNVGAVEVEGRWLRFGLANDSPQMNERLKSGDWIGIRKRLITAADVGHVIGQFVSREIKHAGWVYKGAGREIGQNNWNALVTAWGGDAAFASGEGTL